MRFKQFKTVDFFMLGMYLMFPCIGNFLTFALKMFVILSDCDMKCGGAGEQTRPRQTRVSMGGTRS